MSHFEGGDELLDCCVIRSGSRLYNSRGHQVYRRFVHHLKGCYIIGPTRLKKYKYFIINEYISNFPKLV